MENIDLLAESYNFELDPKFIAARPIAGRHNSKLMVYNAKTGQVIHTKFKNLADFLSNDDMLVLNQSKVFPCRLLGEKTSGGKVEVFILSLVHNKGLYPAMIRANGKKRIGDEFHFGELIVKVEGRGEEGDFLISLNKSEEELLNILEETAHIPIPPYIREGIADESDKRDYQTVYAQELGSVAAPTAGLHFTEDVFAALKDKGIKKSFVTLHVGAGTFKPVAAENLEGHKMHREFFDIENLELEKINLAQNLIAVGTTSLRVLESCFVNGRISLPKTEAPHATEIFLHPGKNIESINGLLTNFHLPKSTLLMLVSSLIGREKTLELYEIAKERDYRFFSYGDAMLILR